MVRGGDILALSMATVSTHDLAPFKGFWTGRDLDWRQRLSLYPDDASRDKDRWDRGIDRWRLLQALSREGLRPDSEYRDLGLAAATGGRFSLKHIRAIAGFQTTGWHWHDMQAHFIYVLRGWITFRFDGVDGEVTLKAGDALSQPAGVPHNVIARSADFEVLELNVPAEYGTFDV